MSGTRKLKIKLLCAKQAMFKKKENAHDKE